MSDGITQAGRGKGLIRRLARIKLRFGDEHRLERETLLEELEAGPHLQVSELSKLHELLCFMQAYPDSPLCLKRVNGLLAGFEELLEQSASRSGQDLESLVDSGMAGTAVEYPFSYHTAKWLAQNFGEDVEIDWARFDSFDLLAEFLPLLASGLEGPAMDDASIDTDEWIKWRAGCEGLTDFAWILRQFLAAGIPDPGLEGIYEILDLPLRWRLRSSSASRTCSTLVGGAVSYQTAPLSNEVGSVRERVAAPLPEFRALGSRRGRDLIDAAYSALSVRGREIYPLFYANPRDVHLVNVERGLAFALIGMQPKKRFSIDTDYFFLGLKNNVPVCYGSGVICLDEVELALNVFSTFRRGESAWLYVELMRVFYQAFGVGSFLVDKFQIGAEDNEDAIESGAFWFYHKLGFRPVGSEVRSVLRGEMTRKRSEGSSYRTRKGTLREIATSDLRLKLHGHKGSSKKIDLSALGLASAPDPTWGEGFDPFGEALGRLGIKDRTCWEPEQLHWFKVFAPLVVRLPDLEQWSASDKRSLVEVVLAKGAGNEFEYQRRLNSHVRLKEALRAVSRVGGRTRTRLTRESQ